MRIVSLLPSATEIVYALGLGDDLVGVTHECDWPAPAQSKRVVSTSALPPAVTPAEVDQLVSASIDGGAPIYQLDAQAVRELRPDLVITQDLCAVCAVPSGHVHEALDRLGCDAEVLSLDPGSLDEVLDSIAQVGRVTGREEQAQHVVDGLRERLANVRRAVDGADRPRTFALEWSDPPFNGGHWVAEMLETAGAEPVLACPGTPSIRVGWDEIAAAAADVVVFMPCGYDLAAAADAAVPLLDRSEFAGAAFYAVDANAYFSRPGPRLVDGVEILAAALHPDRVERSTGATIRRLR
jgi:iron complex transport system substrate-binding protein